MLQAVKLAMGQSFLYGADRILSNLDQIFIIIHAVNLRQHRKQT